jgi:hypothetical protein
MTQKAGKRLSGRYGDFELLYIYEVCLVKILLYNLYASYPMI